MQAKGTLGEQTVDQHIIYEAQLSIYFIAFYKRFGLFYRFCYSKSVYKNVLITDLRSMTSVNNIFEWWLKTRFDAPHDVLISAGHCHYCDS